MTFTEVVYVVAGIAMPAYYVPQMLKCAADQTQLAAYSMSKAATQLGLRAAMLPFVFGIGNLTMTSIVALDFAGRAAEFTVAWWSLHRQGLAQRQIALRCLPLLGRRSPSVATAAATTAATTSPDQTGQGAAPDDAVARELPEPGAPHEPSAATQNTTSTSPEPFHGHHLITFTSGQLPDRSRGRRGAERLRRRGR